MTINNNEVKMLLEEINKMLSRYENMSDDEKISRMISDKLFFDSGMASQIKSGYNSLIELINEWKNRTHIKRTTEQNVWFGDLSTEINAMINLYRLHCEEDRKDLQRARYNLETNNNIFRILDYILNENPDHKTYFLQNSKISKLNYSQFIINYYFEKIRDELIHVMQQDLSNVESEMTILCNRYNNNPKIIQLMYEVLIQNFSTIRNEYKPKSRAIGDYLRSKGVIGDRNTIPNHSVFILLRNCASHGEFYPDIDNEMVEAINTKSNRVVTRNISFDEIINYAKEVSDLFNDDKVNLFRDLLFSNDSLETIKKIKNTYSKDEILKQFGVLLMFNLIQYNNEQYFVRLSESSETNEQFESVNIKDYFYSSFNKDERSTYDFMEVIKNSIGHMNIEFDGSIITFVNRLKNESISASIVKMYDFILSSSICDLAISTNFYVRLSAEKERLSAWLYQKYKIKDDNEKTYDDIYNYNDINLKNIDDYININNKIRK